MLGFAVMVLVAGAAPLASKEPAEVRLEAVRSPLGFELTLPRGFVELSGQGSGVMQHTWVRNTETPEFTLIGVQPYRSVIGRECAPPEQYRKAGMEPFAATWQGMPVCGVRGEKEMKGKTFLDLYVELPLTPKAIAVHVLGYPDHEQQLKAVLGEVLGHLLAETSWRITFGCFTVDVPETWARHTSSPPGQALLSLREPLQVEGKPYRPTFRISTFQAEPQPLERAEADAVAAAKKGGAQELTTKRLQVAGKPASELRFVKVEDGVAIRNRIVLVPENGAMHLLTLSALGAAFPAVAPAGDALLASARFTCRP